MNWSHTANMQHHQHDSNLSGNKKELDSIRRTVEKFSDRFVFGEFSEEFERAGAYLAPDRGLHAGYTFALLVASRLAPSYFRRHIEGLKSFPDHWPCVAFSNHDVMRTATRFGAPPEGNAALAKLMLALLCTLRGTVLIYQGEELGLTEVDLRRDQLRDPVGDLYYPIAKGRDGCRTPMPWDASALNLGFSIGVPWLPLGPTHRALSVSEQESNRESTLSYARRLFAARQQNVALRLGEIEIIESSHPILAFVREFGRERVLCVFNMSDAQARFRDKNLTASRSVGVTSGSVEVGGEQLSLGPFAAHLARF